MSRQDEEDVALANNLSKQVLSELDMLIGVGMVYQLGKAFLGARERRRIQKLEKFPQFSLYLSTYQKWVKWREVAERYVRKKWGFGSKEYIHFTRGNRELNDLFLNAAPQEIKAAFVEQLTYFRSLVEAIPPASWKRVLEYLPRLLTELILRLIGR